MRLKLLPYPCTTMLQLVTRMNSSICPGKGAAPAIMRRIRPPSPSFICTDNNINVQSFVEKKKYKEIQHCTHFAENYLVEKW